MALSQYVAINFLTKFDKKGLERATKELKGFDKVVATGSFRLRAFAKAGGVAAAAGLAIFTKRSISAALAQERLDKSLQLTLSSIGQGALASEISSFIQSLQKTTNVTEDELVPAFQQLVAQTGDVQSSQELLKLALDASAGTGKDLNTVLDAITKAAVGNYKSIGTLGIGISATEAKTLGFAKTMQLLQKYEGDAEEATLTLDGQMKAFKISAGEATETLGTGFLNAYAIISGGQPLIKDLGTDLEVAAKQFSNIFVGIAAATKEEGLGVYFSGLEAFLQGFVGETTQLKDFERMGIKALSIENQTANAREDRVKASKKIMTFDQIIANIQKNILATEKLNTKEKLAQQQLEKKKSELSAMFDIDRINLQVALTRKLSGEDELRVKILQKLQDGTKAAVDEAQRYADVLKVIEDGTISTEEIDMLSKKWGISKEAVYLYLQQIFAANDELRKMLFLLDEISKKKLGGMGAPGASPLQVQIAKMESLNENLIDKIAARSTVPQGLPPELELRIRSQRLENLIGTIQEKAALRGLEIPKFADGGIVNQPTIAMIGEAGAEAVVPLDRMGGFGTTVNVNVAGSVISEGELQSVIQDALYNLNRAGAVTQLSNLGR